MCACLLIGSKNGKLIGTVPKDVKCPLFPTVAVHSQNEEYGLFKSFVSSCRSNLVFGFLFICRKSCL